MVSVDNEPIVSNCYESRFNEWKQSGYRMEALLRGGKIGLIGPMDTSGIGVSRVSPQGVLGQGADFL